MAKSLKESLKENVSFFDSWAGSYDWSVFQYWMKHFHVPILRKLEGKKDVSVLDMSCGTGQLLLAMHRLGVKRLYGADISDNMLDQARKRLPSSVVLRKADVHNLPFKANEFDYVVSTEAFHHYHDQTRALQEMKRVARKGGEVIVVDINFFSDFIHWLFQKIEPGCVKVNSKHEMQELFKLSGLAKISQKRYFLFSVMTSGVKV